MTHSLLTGKKGVILGLANDKSIAWGIAEALHGAGAELAFTYLNEALEKRVRPLAESLGSTIILPCDVSHDSDIEALFTELKKQWGKIDFIIHAIGFANKAELKGGITNTTRDGFALAMDVSAYSFIAVMKEAKAQDILAENASALTLTYLGSDKVVPNYNVMGVAKAALESATRYLAAEFGAEEEGHVRVNAISAGPIKTLAASGIGEFRSMLNHHEETAPLKRLTTQEEVGKAALYLTSDLAEGVTGEIHYVDGGANILGPTPTK